MRHEGGYTESDREWYASIGREVGMLPEEVERWAKTSWEKIPVRDDERVDVAVSGGPLSLAQIGTVMGMSRERVRQIEEIAMRKIRRAMAGRPAEEIVTLLRELQRDRDERCVAEPETVAIGDAKAIDDGVAESEWFQRRERETASVSPRAARRIARNRK